MDSQHSAKRSTGHEPSGKEILSEFSDDLWGTPEELAEDSIIKSVKSDSVDRIVERRLTFRENEMTRELSKSQTIQLDFKDKFMPIVANERETFIPDGYEDGYANFLKVDSVQRSVCSECRGKKSLRCTKCKGKGLKDDKICGKCNGNGKTRCKTCEGDGKTSKFKFVRRTYTEKTDEMFENGDIPETVLSGAEGSVESVFEQKSGEVELDGNALKCETTRYSIPTTTVDYEYEGENYTIYQVDGEPEAKNFPKSRTRKAAPVVVLVLCIAVGVGAAHYLGMI